MHHKWTAEQIAVARELYAGMLLPAVAAEMAQRFGIAFSVHSIAKHAAGVRRHAARLSPDEPMSEAEERAVCRVEREIAAARLRRLTVTVPVAASSFIAPLSKEQLMGNCRILRSRTDGDLVRSF